MPDPLNDHDLLLSLIDPVRDACRVIESIKAEMMTSGGMVSTSKSDKSPVTIADQAAEDVIFAALQRLTPNVPRVGEEAFSAGFVPEDCGSTFWLIDPIDGTRGFIAGGNDYTVNIALVRHYEVVLGIVATPANGRIWYGGNALPSMMIDPDGTISAIAVRSRPVKPVVLVSHSHLDDRTKTYVEELGDIERLSLSSSLKFCVVAEGKADIYPRYGDTSEWDTAAGHAVVNGAGGSVTTEDGTELRYGKQGFRNGPFFVNGAAA
jgi:3'(2'), 5'-bisphosphate nucleotidase